MKKNIVSIFILLVFIISTSCKKETDTTPTNSEDDFFIANKGLTKVWETTSIGGGLGGFHNGHLTFSKDGFIQMLFTYGTGGVNGSDPTFELYRKSINLSTGVANDIPLPSLASSGLSSASFMQEDGNCHLIPYTNQFAFVNHLGAFEGEPTWLPSNLYTFAYGASSPAKLYETKQIAQTSYVPFNNTTIGAFFTNGVYSYEEKVIDAPNYCSSLEMTPTGIPLLFTAGEPTLQVHNFATNTQLASIPIDLFLNLTFPPHEAVLRTKRSTDGTKIIGCISKNIYRVLHYSTFIYDISSNSFTKKMDNIAFQNEPLSLIYDFDEEGNIYYPTTQAVDYQIRKITPTSESVIASGFMTTGYIINVKAVSGKLFVVLSSPGNNMYSGDKGKGRMVVTVAK